MNITKLIIIFCFLLTALTASAMKYQIKVLNTPTITIDNKAAKVGDWFDDQSVIVWSQDNQAMRVVSEDNKVYTLSAKLYKESKSKKFSDFIIYTKPLAARGTNDHDLIEQLAERFDNTFVMLDEIVIDLSDIEVPHHAYFLLKQDFHINQQNEIRINVKDKSVIIKREYLILTEEGNRNSEFLSFSISFVNESNNSEILISNDLQIECLEIQFQ